MGSQKIQLALVFLIWASLACLSFSIPSEYSITAHDLDISLTEERIVELFQQWKLKHNRVYKHTQEAEKRLQNFRHNLKYVIEKNAQRKSASSHQVGLNRFADMSNQEFKQVYLAKVKSPIKKMTNLPRSMQGNLKTCDAPSTLDWRNKGIVTAVKDQGSCGSCWAFSSTGAIEGINALVTGDLISLSEQELVDCDSSNYGCEGGYMDYAFEWVISNGGIDSETDYPYTGVDGTCNTTKEETKVVTIDGYQDVEQTEAAVLCATVQQPLAVGMDGSTIDFQLYTGGIYDGSCSSDPNDIDHAVLIVGYGTEDDEDYWIVKNSWGTYWGIDGYFYIKRNTNLTYGVCAINAMVSYPTKESASPSPYPSPTPPTPSSPPPPSPTPPSPTPPSPTPPSPTPPSPTPPSPTPPSPSPSQCGDFSYCPRDETCCCIFEFYNYCFIYGCCGYENAVCCEGTEYCCPSDYPICDIEEGLCLRNHGDHMGISAKKRKMAKHKLPWSKIEENEQKKTYQPLLWKRNQFAAMR